MKILPLLVTKLSLSVTLCNGNTLQNDVFEKMKTAEMHSEN